MQFGIVEAASFMALVLGIIATINGFARNKEKDDKTEAAAYAAVNVNLELIKTDLMEIKNDVKSVKEDVKQHTIQIAKLEESVKSCWRAVNKIQDESGNENS